MNKNVARIKSLNIVVDYVGTPYITNDLGKDKSPRFELLDETTLKVIEKSDNPMNFHDIVFGRRNNNAEFSEEPKKHRGRPRKSPK